MHDIDEYIQAQLILAALNITTHVLQEGGSFVAKIFRGKDISLLFSQLGIFFTDVYCTKPKSSRSSSMEHFVVCKNFHLPKDYAPTMIQPLLDQPNQLTGMNNLIVPFLACGDLSGFDEQYS
jgi:tRNA (cytidine32/guanosine34-2'-O)-methyltransferase